MKIILNGGELKSTNDEKLIDLLIDKSLHKFTQAYTKASIMFTQNRKASQKIYILLAIVNS